jgi:hypothetical protein
MAMAVKRPADAAGRRTRARSNRPGSPGKVRCRAGAGARAGSGPAVGDAMGVPVLGGRVGIAIRSAFVPDMTVLGYNGT